jgi:8-oxo-dGTP pyrophosphatase MutT (NUDIX family)
VATDRDISWHASEGTFNLRVAAIITHREMILLCRIEKYWFLPGGRVRFGETSDVALARELREELGHELTISGEVLTVENIYTEETLQHEIDVYYRLTWPQTLAENDLDGGSEPSHTFGWIPLRDLGSVWFEPAALVPILQNPHSTVRHMLLDQRTG